MKPLSQNKLAIDSRNCRAAMTPEQKASAAQYKKKYYESHRPQHAKTKRVLRAAWTPEQKEHHREYKREYYQAHKQECNATQKERRKFITVDQVRQIREQTKIWIKERRKIVRNYKEEAGCMDCGYANPIALDFDHRDPENKSFSISVGITAHHMDKIWLEIAKCDVVCKNCHAIRTAKTFKWAV